MRADDQQPNSVPRGAQADDPFSVPIRRTAIGAIDHRYYLERGRRLRSRAWRQAVGSAARRVVGLVAVSRARARSGRAAHAQLLRHRERTGGLVHG